MPEYILIEYDRHDGKRIVKSFNNSFQSRQFWIRMDKQNRNPKIIKKESNEDLQNLVEGQKPMRDGEVRRDNS